MRALVLVYRCEGKEIGKKRGMRARVCVYSIQNLIRHAITIKTGLSDFEVRLCVYELLRALAWTHARGVMHRDVKNKNVLVDRTTRALRCVQPVVLLSFHCMAPLLFPCHTHPFPSIPNKCKTKQLG